MIPRLIDTRNINIKKILYVLAALLVALIIISKFTKGDKEKSPSTPVMKVYATPMKAVEEIITIRASGSSKASQKINLLSETSGEIYKLHHQKGHMLSPKDTIATIQLDDRAQQLKEARAAYNLAKERLNIAQKLAEGNYASEINLKTAQVDYESATTRLARIEKEVQNTKIIAPFKGVLGDVMLEEGSVVAPGTLVATLLNLDPVLVQVYVSEKNYASLTLGSAVNCTFSDGQASKGVISFISTIADSKTHMFLVEISIPNPEFKIPEGVTAKVEIPTVQTKVHKINPSVLAIDPNGNMSVKVVNTDNKVESYPVKLVQSIQDTIWVTGLPDEVTVINYGAHFVNVGETVQWEPAETLKGIQND